MPDPSAGLPTDPAARASYLVAAEAARAADPIAQRLIAEIRISDADRRRLRSLLHDCLGMLRPIRQSSAALVDALTAELYLAGSAFLTPPAERPPEGLRAASLAESDHE